MKYKAQPKDVDAHKVTVVVPRDGNGVTTVYAEDLGKVDLTAVECGKYEPGIGDFIVVEGDEKSVLPADVFASKYVSAEASDVSDEQKQADVQKKQNNQDGQPEEVDVHKFLDDKNKKLAP